MKAYFITENFQINTVWRYEQTCDHISVCSGSYAYSWIYNQPSSVMAVFCQLTLSIGNVSPRLRTWSVNVSDIDEGKGWFCWFVTPRRQPKFKIASMSLLCRDNGMCNHVSSCEYIYVVPSSQVTIDWSVIHGQGPSAGIQLMKQQQTIQWLYGIYSTSLELCNSSHLVDFVLVRCM